VTWIWYILQVYHVCVCVSRAHTFSPYAFEHVKTYYRDSKIKKRRWQVLLEYARTVFGYQLKGKAPAWLASGATALGRCTHNRHVLHLRSCPHPVTPSLSPLSHPTFPCARADWTLVCLAYAHVKDGCSCVYFMYMLRLCVCRCRSATAVCTQGTARGKPEEQSAQVAGAQGGGHVDAPRSRCPLRSAQPLVWDPLILFFRVATKILLLPRAIRISKLTRPEVGGMVCNTHMACY